MSHSTISLPTARAYQLRRLAEHRGVPATDLLDQYIRDLWGSAGFEPDLPPFDVSVGRDDDTDAPRIFFAAPGTHILDFTPAQASKVVSGLNDLAAGATKHFVVPAQCAGGRAGIVGEKRGRGFALKIADDLDGAPRATVISGLTKTIAADLGRIFEDRAVKARALIS